MTVNRPKQLSPIANPNEAAAGTRPMRGLGIVAALGAILACGGCSKAPSEPPNIIFVSIDSLRSDHVGCYGYGRETTPFIDSLAKQGVRFENAFSTTSWTLPSHASMFTGLLGPTHGLVDNGLSLSEDHATLAELLKEQGYHTAGFFGGPYLHPTFGLGQGFDVYRSCMTTTPDTADGDAIRGSASASNAPSHVDITGPRTRKEVKRWADERMQAQGESPYFLFLHLWDVHYDFTPPKDFEQLFVDPNYSGPADGRLMSNAAIRPGMAVEDIKHVLDLYDAEIRFTDEILKRILGDLEERGLMKNTMVVVTADHGEEFFEHGFKGHNKSLFDEVLRVPLVVSWPDEIDEDEVVMDQVQIIDIMPTLLSVAGVNKEIVSQGQDLSPLLSGESMPARDALSGLFIDGGSQRALRSNERKVWSFNDQSPAVYIDLVTNPQEKLDEIITPQTGHSQSKRQHGEQELRSAAKRAEELKTLLQLSGPNHLEMSEDMRQQLEALGYLGGEPNTSDQE